MNKSICLLLFALITVFTGCKKFLDVKIPDRIMEDDLFNSSSGFRSALNGIYLEMNTDHLYGKNLTVDNLDVMAQYYQVTTVYSAFKQFNYQDASVSSYFDAVWQKHFNLIVNANTLIERSTQSGILSENDRNILLGESLALRAFLHFDVLRLWGPIYSEQTKSVKVMPYNKVIQPQVLPLVTSEEIIYHIIDDLKTSLKYLEKSDPVITEGRRNSSDLINGDFTSFRQFRLNYFAVKALLARVYLWKKDTVNAGLLANEVIKETQEDNVFFPFVNREDAVSPTTPDRIFSSEILFAGYDNTRTAMFNATLGPNAASAYRLSVSSGRASEMYDDNSDFRYLAYAVQTVGTSTVYYNRKFEPVSSQLDNYIPLIRISEMYYIAAECAPSYTQASTLVNKVRAARSARDLIITDQTGLNTALNNEYRREFLNEGQLFYYYKRKGLTAVADGASNTGSINIPLSSYVLPMVNSEVSQRN